MALQTQETLATRSSVLRIPLPGMQCSFGVNSGSFNEKTVSKNGTRLLRDRDSLLELPQDTRREDEPSGDEGSGIEGHSFSDRVLILLGKVESYEKRCMQYPEFR